MKVLRQHLHYSSVDDLAKWDQALYGGGPLSQDSVRVASPRACPAGSG
jgi:hypothetical protein